METHVRKIFDLIANGVVQEADRVRGYPTAAPLYRYAGLSGLAARGEAHLTHAIARTLDTAGYLVFVDEPYCVNHERGRIKRFDLRIALDRTQHPYSTPFLTLEVKRFTMIDGAMRGMLDDAQKILNILKDEYRLLSIPIGLLLIGFSHNERDDWHRRRYASFERRSGISAWLHLNRDVSIAPDGEAMRICMMDLWCYVNDADG